MPITLSAPQCHACLAFPKTEDSQTVFLGPASSTSQAVRRLTGSSKRLFKSLEVNSTSFSLL